MKVEIIYPEKFATWGNAIGVILYSREQDEFVNLFTGDMEHSRVNRKEIGSPSLVELELELEHNESLRYLAKQNQLITVTYQHTLDFLEYASSYN